MWVIRWILVALSAVLATVLILHGNVVIGVVIGAMVIARTVLFVRLQHRREQFRARIGQRRDSRP